jgi:HAD superfamily hydrolase (TIGR01509 family)
MSPASPLRAVVFDLDGLMFNTEQLYYHVGSEMLRRRGKVLTQDLINQMIGRPSRVALQTMIDWHQLDDTVETLLRDNDAIFDELLPTRLAPMPGLLPLLQSLDRAEIPKAIGTSSRRVFVDKVLRPFALGPRFQFLLTSESVQRGKPAPDIYLLAADRFGIRPSEMMVLEDSEIGCSAAVAAGTFAVAVPGDHSAAHCFDGAQFVADSLADTRIYESLGLTRSLNPAP